MTLWAAARQAPLSLGIVQARILAWVAMPSSMVSSLPRIEPESLMSIELSRRFFTTSATWEAIYLTHDNVYISMLFSQLVPRLLPLLCPLIITPC